MKHLESPCTDCMAYAQFVVLLHLLHHTCRFWLQSDITDALHKDLPSLIGNRVRVLSDNCLFSLPAATSQRVLGLAEWAKLIL